MCLLELMKYSSEFKGTSYWEILENMFRLDEYQQAINSLKMSSTANFYPYSRETGKINLVPRKIVPTDFIIFNTSIMLGRMDYIIMVDMTQDNIIKRKLLRDKDIRTPDQIVEMHRGIIGLIGVGQTILMLLLIIMILIT
ncbi:MAG: hypothetical protein PWQ10_26 [Patescibacteria group bacterium]|nr:hypothetical protein [Patescibacteria group bacterium]